MRRGPRRADLEVDAFEDLGAVDRDVQVDDLEEGVSRGASVARLKSYLLGHI